MDHFEIIQALVRTGLATGEPAVRKQVERLRDAAREAADTKSARSLDGLLSSAGRASVMAPSRMTQSRAVPIGEVLSPSTPPPVDRETSVPLAEILHSSSIDVEMPLFDPAVARASRTLVDEWLKSALLEKSGISPARSCLIFGAPGTGKTTLALWMAKQLGLPVVLAKLDGIISSFLGNTARNVGALFSFANRYRCILLLDEFDAIAKVRDDPQEVGEIKRVVNALLQNVDARSQFGITIAVTNHEKLLDPAIWRRFEIQIRVPKPGVAGRRQIVKRYLDETSIGEAGERLLTWLTEDMSGSEIETFVRGLRKQLVISEGSMSLVESLQSLSVMSAGRISPSRARFFEADVQDLAELLLAERELDMKQSDVAEFLGKDKATISRWVSGRKRGDP